MTATRGEHIVGWAYRAALAIAAPLLLGGMITGSTPLLRAGILVLMATPLVGVVLVAGALVAARDWPFAGVALLVLAILGSSLYAASRVAVRPPESAPAARPSP